ncbi:uncharacterized protein GLRG_10757 [Colletotrichum graminicola M1.001]|uniref:Uncharacterized protein n=1 Tax=Colletotrichum graminicola (strain M1.001 / M2 / FGSC 10212) TaxID=645133 RepID=E3QXM5_COLGM|nr:uncharacterized protein GLRG_10757 [Colletotrichum graminicola M1.001]EFQ35613.1 hypothetical protein GLRG_10757 [Colletotrichum graminicola M1.001]
MDVTISVLRLPSSSRYVAESRIRSNSVSSSLSSIVPDESGENSGTAVSVSAAISASAAAAAAATVAAGPSISVSLAPFPVTPLRLLADLLGDDVLEYELMSSSSIRQLLHRIPIPESENRHVGSRACACAIDCLPLPMPQPPPPVNMSSSGRRLGRMLHLLQRMSVGVDCRKLLSLPGLESTPDEYSASVASPFGDRSQSSESRLGPTSDSSVSVEMRGNGTVSIVETGAVTARSDLTGLVPLLLSLFRFIGTRDVSFAAVPCVGWRPMARPRWSSLSTLLALDVDDKEKFRGRPVGESFVVVVFEDTFLEVLGGSLRQAMNTLRRCASTTRAKDPVMKGICAENESSLADCSAKSLRRSSRLALRLDMQLLANTFCSTCGSSTAGRITAYGQLGHRPLPLRRGNSPGRGATLSVGNSHRQSSSQDLNVSFLTLSLRSRALASVRPSSTSPPVEGS